MRYLLLKIIDIMCKYKKEDLEKLILVEGKSYSSIGKMYGVSGASIKKAAKHLGLELPIRRKINPNENFSHPKYVSTSFVNRIDDETFRITINSSSTWKSIGEKLGYSGNISSNVKDSVVKRCKKLGLTLSFDKDDSVGERTKGELFEMRKNWQSARSAIRKHAQSVFSQYNSSNACALCGYDKHIEIAHIKAVSEFEDSSLVREINAIDNLIPLCPNHHWEFDNGLISVEELQNIKRDVSNGS